MNKLLKGILWALAIEAAAVAVIFVCDRVAGTGWALPVAAMVGLPLLLVSFPEKKRRPRGYSEAHRRARAKYTAEPLNIGDWPKKENA